MSAILDALSRRNNGARDGLAAVEGQIIALTDSQS